MKYLEVLDFLETRLNYERVGMPSSRELRIDRMAMLLSRLDWPDRRYQVIHVAGTKGKGSTCHLLSALLEANGFRVGLHTSPHLERFEERLLVNSEMPDADRIAQLGSTLIPIVAEIDRELVPDQPELTYFEITTAMVLLHFARRQVDWGVIEVGMGGRLDATNVVRPEVTVITSISMDHTRQLGDTLARIAREKAGIIKSGCPVVSGVVEDEPREVIREVAAGLGVELRELGVDVDFRYTSRGLAGGTVEVRTWRRAWPLIRLRVPGEHQAANCAIALAALEFVDGDRFPMDPSLAPRALANLTIPGRIEVIGRNPLIILDVAHNPASAAALARTLDQLPRNPETVPPRRVLVFGATRDKDWRRMLLDLAQRFDAVILTKYESNPRALPVQELTECLRDWPGTLQVAPCGESAWRDAVALLEAGGRSAGPDDLICVTGSFYLAAELRPIAMSFVRRRQEVG